MLRRQRGADLESGALVWDRYCATLWCSVNRYSGTVPEVNKYEIRLESNEAEVTCNWSLQNTVEPLLRHNNTKCYSK